jgi:hypothetical protein
MAAKAKKEVKKAKNSKVRKVSPRTFSPEKREEIMKKWYALRESMNAFDAAKKLGVSYLSLHRWEQHFGKPKGAGKPAPVASLQEHKERKERKARKVKVPPQPKAPTVTEAREGIYVVTTPDGHRIECPNVEGVKKLLNP